MSDTSSQGTHAPKKLRRYSAEEKKKIIDRSDEVGIMAASRESKVCPTMVRSWRKRFETEGLAGLVNKPTRPHHQPKKTSQWIIDKVLGVKKERPEVGIQATSEYLARFEGIEISPNTIRKVFKKHELPDGDTAAAEASYHVKGDKDRLTEQAVEAEIDEWERFSRPHPNDLWQMDIMSFYIRGAHKVYLISALDDCSRLIVNWGLYREQTADNVLEVLRVALAKHGAPKEVLTDQGAQFKHWGGVTQFEKLLSKLAIEHIKARAHHPQTCGKIEAFHKTLHRELIDKEFFLSQEAATEKIARYIEHYNHARPHSSLEGFTPADRYFGVIDAVKRYLADIKVPNHTDADKADAIAIGRGSKIYLVGKLMGQEIRIQELAGSLSIHVNQRLFKEISLVH